MCMSLQAHLDDTENFWIRANTCDEESNEQYIELFCDIYGDFSLINEDYDGTEVGYQISYSCDRYREDVGGAQTFAATLIAAFAAFLLLN